MLNKNDIVVTNRKIGSIKKGSQGYVKSVNTNPDSVDVRITHNPDCTLHNGFTLIAQDHALFEKKQKC